MKKLIFFLMFCSKFCHGQKPPLTLDSYKAWPDVGGGGLSNDGKYAFYTVQNYPAGKSTFYLKTTAGKEIISIVGLYHPQFSSDSRYLIGLLSGDSLLLFDLKRYCRQKVPAVKSYELQKVGRQEHLLLKTKAGTILQDFVGRNLYTFHGLKQHKFSSDGKVMIVVLQDSIVKDQVAAYWLNVPTGKQRLIYKGTMLTNIIFDANANQAAFMVNNEGGNSIYYYRTGADHATLLVDNNSAGIAKGLTIETGLYWKFSKDGERIFFSLKGGAKPKRQHEIPGLEIWSYQDAYLRSYYDGKMFGFTDNIGPKQYLSTVAVKDRSIKQLLSGEQKVVYGSFNRDTDSVLVVEESRGLSSEDWNPKSRASYFLCFTKTGEMLPLENNRMPQITIWNISPTGKYILYYDPAGKYICYDIKSQKKSVVSEGIKDSFFQYQYLDFPMAKYPVGITGWLQDDESLLINATFDIWKVDPKGVQPAVNLTEAKGSQNKTVFYLASERIGGVVGRNGNILLSAFDTRNKDYGFYKVDLRRKHSLQRLSMAPRFSGNIHNIYTQLVPYDFIRTGKGQLLLWQSFDRAPNYFYSKDLMTFTPISNIQPHQDYNWLTVELHTYKDRLGNSYQGILYKPENFDSCKTYPVVLNYYENRSNELNKFGKPELFAGADFTVSLLVSNGYMVFKPDVHGIIEAPGEGALRSVLAAADHLATLPFVNAKKMAITGHSFGGFETNYIITHTNRFAAAISGAGMSNMIAFYSDLWGSGADMQLGARTGTIMLNRTMTDAPDVYIRNSPIIQSNKVTTPIMFLHNNGDGNVSVHHTRSFFIMLRSLQKTCWWLNYKQENHGINEEQNQLDFTKKMISFLDHYLKDTPMADWMVEHI